MKKTAIGVMMLCVTLWLGGMAAAAERGAKSLFYDPTSAGTIQVANPGEGGAGGKFTSSVKKYDANGNEISPVSNYYENLNPGVMYWIELVRPGSGNVKRVSNDRVFRSGDRIRIHVTTNADGYLHVLHTGSTGAAGVIPVSSAANGMVQMGNDYIVPSSGGWLRFDGNPGKEEVKLLFASVKSSGDVLNAVRGVTVRNASTASGQLFAIYNQYRNSPHYIREIQSGSKDLIPEGAAVSVGFGTQPQYGGQVQTPAVNAPLSYPPPVRFNTQGAADFTIDNAVYTAPANYVVSRAPGQVKEPVVVGIVLNHHP